jgi:predicted Rossmann fold flavoprotein
MGHDVGQRALYHRLTDSAVIVVGAGAAGIMAAIFAADAGASTMLLERTPDGGHKILISGGGRCNILPADVDERRFVTDSSPHTVRRILRSWPLAAQMAFFERDLGIPLVEEHGSGKLFPRSQRARDVRDALLDRATRHGVRIVTNTHVTNVRPSTTGWNLELESGAPIPARAVVLATGGLSVPSTGSDGGGLRIATALGHAVHPTYPALTPLTADRLDTPFRPLAGLSLPVAITATSERHEARAAGGFLFTHRGYSGPAVLDVSHVAVRSRIDTGNPATITVQWTSLGDGEWTKALRPAGARTVLTVVAAEVPRRLAEGLIASAGVQPNRSLAQLTKSERLRLIEALVRGSLPWSADEGYRKAEVTGGGVALSEIDPRTLESRTHRGLFLCGEMLDVFGPIGGYNFLWAWATGRAAGLGAAERVRT